METEEQWVSLSEAAFQLRKEGYDISLSKLSRMATNKEIQTEKDPIDKRVRLVELNALRRLFGSSKRYRE